MAKSFTHEDFVFVKQTFCSSNTGEVWNTETLNTGNYSELVGQQCTYGVVGGG